MNNDNKENELKSCPECGGDDNFHFDPFNFGNLLDQHTDTQVDTEDINKRFIEAAELASKLGGYFSPGLEEELGHLIKPTLTWQDFVRLLKIKRKRAANKNDWSAPKRKPLLSGLYVPKKIDYIVKFLLAYDCSGSMTKNQISYGISQILALTDKGEGYCLPWDHQPYYDAMIKIKNVNHSQIKNAKYKGGGGTTLLPVFETYRDEIGDVDVIIIISDFQLSDMEQIQKMKKIKNTEVVWLSINNNEFIPPFGKKFSLYNE